MLEEVNNRMINEITELVNQTRTNLAREINRSIIYVNWNIGRIIVSNESQKKILIGKGGSMIKKIGTNARVELEKITEKKVFLELFVKVVKNWQKDDNFIKSLGLEVK